MFQRTIVLGALALVCACVGEEPSEKVDALHDGVQGGVDKVTICHVPPGNPENPQTITIGEPAVASHFAEHPGDHYGPCEETSDGGANPDGGGEPDGGAGGDCPCEDKYGCD